MIPALIVVACLVLLAVALMVTVHFKTMPRDLSDPSRIPIGGMVTSADYDYIGAADKKTMRSPIVRLMQLLWINTSKSDAENHSTQTPPPGIVELNNIPYVDDGSIYHLLDVYFPAENNGKLPVIIDIHGGGWMYGDKELNKLYCLALASKGYTVFNVSYPLAPDVTVDVQVQDVMKALQWIGEHIGNYPCNAENVLLTGDSAGGMLAAYAAVLSGSEPLRQIFGAVPNDLRFTGLLLTSPVPSMNEGGYMSLYTKRLWGSDRKKKECFRYANFKEIVSFAKLPRTYLITSAGDILGHNQTVDAYERIKNTGVECYLKDFGGKEGKKLPHVFTVLNPYNEIGKSTIDEALAWFKKEN